jgi:drug/metabolite transporter (DMT)-like permease
MQNTAYRLALLAGVGGLLLLTWAPQGGVETSLGTALLAVAGLLAGLGTVIDLLGYVKEGATDTDDLH